MRLPNDAVVGEIFAKLGLRYALVVQQGRLLGVLTRKDLLQYINDQHARHHSKAHRGRS